MGFWWVKTLPCCAVAAQMVGCAGPELRETTALSLVHAGNADVVRAQSEFDGEGLLIRGTVAGKGLAPRTNVSESSWGWASPPGPTFSTSEQKIEHESIAVVALEPGGQVLCYFEQDRLEQVASIVVGRPITLECTFYHYRPRPSGPVAILTSCEVSERARGD